MRFAVLGLVVLFALGADNGSGCNNSVVGVQDYGSVTGRVIDTTSNQPVSNALISVGSLYTAYADRGGAFTVPNIPVGPQTITVRAPGYQTTSVIAHIRKDQTYSVSYIALRPTSNVNGGPSLPLPTMAATTEPTMEPTPMEQSSPSATASP
jgi:hypothetical protein